MERAITLTDAVVAIAMTLLVLPLVEASAEIDTHDLGSALRDHANLLLSFVVSFLVIYVFWAAHSTAFGRLRPASSRTSLLGPLNMVWLLILAFLPFPTALVGRELNTSTAPLYVGTMLVLSALTSTIIMIIDRSVGASGRVLWSWLTTVVFAGCTVLSSLNPDLGLFALLLLAAVRAAEAYHYRQHSPADHARPPALGSHA